jgi:TatD DNase family protein
MKFFDSHCHLQFDVFDGLREDIISEMVENDAKAIIVGSSIESSKEGVLLSNKYLKCLYSSVGVHPVHSLNFEIYKDSSERNKSLEYPQDLNKLRGLICDKVKAIGECGIDFSYLRALKESDEQIDQ